MYFVHHIYINTVRQDRILETPLIIIQNKNYGLQNFHLAETTSLDWFIAGLFDYIISSWGYIMNCQLPKKSSPKGCHLAEHAQMLFGKV